MVFDWLFGFDFPPLVLLAVALIVILVIQLRCQTPANLPPSPGRPYPVLGHLPYLGAEARDQLLELSKTMGGIFSMYFGSYLVIILSSYDVFREALLKQADYFTDRPLGGPSSVLQIGNGIIATSGPLWKDNRSAVVQILKELGVGKDIMSQKIMEEVKFYLAHLEDLRGKASNIKDITSCAISNVTCNIVLGKRFELNDSDFLEILHLLEEFMAQAGGNKLSQWFPQVKYLPGDLFGSKRLQEVDNIVMNKMNHFIESVLNEMGDQPESNNFISAYVEKMKEKQSGDEETHLSLKQLDRVVFDLVIGGSETTNTTLLWFYMYMIHYPDIQEKFYQEIATKIGTNRTPTGQDKVSLSYVNAVILETQRLATISPFSITHRCTTDTTICGYNIPKDAHVLLHLDSVLLDDKIWGDALTFRPERFLNDGKLFCPEHFVAFGLGRRSCPGEALARMELFLFSVSVIQRFKIAPADPNHLPPRTYIKGATCPPTPFSVRFIERN